MKFIKVKDPGETRGPGFNEKFLPGGILKICPRVTGGGGGRIRLEKTAGPCFGWFIISGKSALFENQKSFGFLSQIILHVQ